MTRFALALGCFLLLAGCGGDLHSKLLGEWQVDTEYLKTTDEYKKMSDMEKGMMEGMLGAMTMKITEDTVTMMGQTIKYSVKSQDGDKIVLESTDAKDKNKEVTISFDGDTMLFHGDKGETIPFKRKS